MIPKPMTQKITAIFGIAVLAAILLGGLTFAQSAMADRPGNTDPPKVVICHVPPGNPDNPQTIAVDPEEAAEHLASMKEILKENVVMASRYLTRMDPLN